MEIILIKNGVKKRGYTGFSFAVGLFGPLIAAHRQDYKWIIIMSILLFMTGTLSQFVFAFTYNNIYTKNLLKAGFVPADDYSRQALLDAGIAIV